jgi:hypothetical protein
MPLQESGGQATPDRAGSDASSDTRTSIRPCAKQPRCRTNLPRYVERMMARYYPDQAAFMADKAAA